MWYKNKGIDNDVVISTRLRLARNISGISFPGKMTEDDARAVIEKVKAALPEMVYNDIHSMTETELMVLIEKHLISKDIASSKLPGGFFTCEDDRISVMVNEEDHLRIQVIISGYDLSSAYELINLLDDKIEKNLSYAFSEKYGFLTKCPSNAGTGMRASVMLHLPGLTMTDNIGTMVAAVGKLGITVRGMYGEGSSAAAHIYQVSNQVTLGVSEAETLQNLKNIVDMLIERERHVRQTLLENNPEMFTDKVSRAFGNLAYAHIMSTEEFLNLISYVRMGISMGIIDNMDISEISALLTELQPAHIASALPSSDKNSRDIKRAEILRKTLNRQL